MKLMNMHLMGLGALFISLLWRNLSISEQVVETDSGFMTEERLKILESFESK